MCHLLINVNLCAERFHYVVARLVGERDARVATEQAVLTVREPRRCGVCSRLDLKIGL